MLSIKEKAHIILNELSNEISINSLDKDILLTSIRIALNQIEVINLKNIINDYEIKN